MMDRNNAVQHLTVYCALTAFSCLFMHFVRCSFYLSRPLFEALIIMVQWFMHGFSCFRVDHSEDACQPVTKPLLLVITLGPHSQNSFESKFIYKSHVIRRLLYSDTSGVVFQRQMRWTTTGKPAVSGDVLDTVAVCWKYILIRSPVAFDAHIC